MQYYQTHTMSMETCLLWIDERVSPNGMMAIEDYEKKAFDILKAHCDIVSYFVWFIRKGESSDPLSEMRLAMKNMLISSCNLKSLSKRVIVSHCSNLNTLPLPRRIIDYLKE